MATMSSTTGLSLGYLYKMATMYSTRGLSLGYFFMMATMYSTKDHSQGPVSKNGALGIEPPSMATMFLPLI